MINVRKKRKNYISFLIVIILLVLIYISYNNRYIKNIKIFFNNIGNSIRNNIVIDNSFNNNISLGINTNLLKENSELKKLLDIKEDNYNIKVAKVIKREDWYQELIIDKGIKDNIEVDMAVINNNGLIGKIIEVGKNYSKVLLITSNKKDIKVAIDIIGEEDYHGILDSYSKKDDLLIINSISKNSNIKIGDNVYSNGLGGIYPSGIYIGKVVDISNDKYGLSKIVKVKTDTNYDNIKYVLIVGNK